MREKSDFVHSIPRILLGILAIPMGIVAAFGILCFLWYFIATDGTLKTHYRTENVSDYGNFVGNRNNDIPTEFITSFFPAEIEDPFRDVEYVYQSVRVDAYTCEAMLTFTVDSQEDYQSYVNQVTNGQKRSQFYFDPSYSEYTLFDQYELDTDTCRCKNKGENHAHIQYAKIGKILFLLKNAV